LVLAGAFAELAADVGAEAALGLGAAAVFALDEVAVFAARAVAAFALAPAPVLALGAAVAIALAPALPFGEVVGALNSKEVGVAAGVGLADEGADDLPAAGADAEALVDGEAIEALDALPPAKAEVAAFPPAVAGAVVAELAKPAAGNAPVAELDVDAPAGIEVAVTLSLRTADVAFVANGLGAAAFTMGGVAPAGADALEGADAFEDAGAAESVGTATGGAAETTGGSASNASTSISGSGGAAGFALGI
jgi:hypothetical protein